MDISDFSKDIVEEISDADYANPMLDLSPLPEIDMVAILKTEPKQNVAELVSDLLAA